MKLVLNRFFLFLYFILSHSVAFATVLYGKITDENNNPLPFATISVTSLKKTSMSNERGQYSITLHPGSYTISCQHIGYKEITIEKQISGDSLRLDFKLLPTVLMLNEVVIKKSKEDPANEIIRNAILKRKYHLSQVESFSCQAYIKGLIRTVDFPESILGQRIDFEDGDTSKQKIIFLSETLADIVFRQPDEYRINVISTRVSGQTNGLGLSTPFFISFYDNIVKLPKAFNPRGFVSPIADGAFNFYEYKYLGAFASNGKMINRIQVFPKRVWEPLFSGYIEIIENSWNFHAVELTLTKTAQLEIADQIKIVQQFKPVAGDIWLINSQNIFPEVSILGFKASGYFNTLFENYDLNYIPTKKTFGNTLIKYDSLSNQYSDLYWSQKRPIPLLAIEQADFIKKDSLERRKKDPVYLDSLDRLQNRPTFLGLTLNGQTLQKRSKKQSFTYDPLLKSVGFNTIEGLVLQLSGTLDKELKNSNKLAITPVLRYGVSNRHLTGFISANLNTGKKYDEKFNIAVGSKIFQFNNANPIPQVMNTFSTLIGGNNYLKLYQADFFQLSHSRDLLKSINFEFSIAYQDRSPLVNTAGAGQWGKYKNLSEISPNYPEEVTNLPLTRHQALDAGLKLKIRTGARYVELPDGSVNSFSKSPLIYIQYNKGINGFWGSDVKYDKWKISVKGDLNFQLAGEFRYNIVMAGFLSSNNLQTPDFHHYAGNLTSKATTYLETFQLAPFYAFSNNAKIFGAMHTEYKLNGLLTNKIPLIRNLNFRLITGCNILVLKNINYQEVFVGLDNIAKLFRLDYVKGLGKDGMNYNGFRIGIRGFSTLFSDY
ncbi:MAG: hypothetical protein RLZZ172_1374 [Bacteroidota bacterium]